MKEIYFQLFKTSEGFNVIDMASKEIVEKGLMRKEPILKLISRLKKQVTVENECKAYFLTEDNKVIMSRIFKTRKYSRFKVIKKSALDYYRFKDN
jgi:hypothetical protein